MTLTPKQALVADALISFVGNRGVKIKSHDELIDYIIEAKRIQPPPPTRKTIDCERTGAK